MKPIEASELKAFILALLQVDSPLPNTVLEEINAIKIPGDIDKLEAIANSYPPLATSYNQVWQYLHQVAPVRSKGLDSIPEFPRSSPNTEIANASREIEDALVKFEQVDVHELATNSEQSFKALKSGKTPRDVIKKIFHKL